MDSASDDGALDRINDSANVGDTDGVNDDGVDGEKEGIFVGAIDGDKDGDKLGADVGAEDGTMEYKYHFEWIPMLHQIVYLLSFLLKTVDQMVSIKTYHDQIIQNVHVNKSVILVHEYSAMNYIQMFYPDENMFHI